MQPQGLQNNTPRRAKQGGTGNFAAGSASPSLVRSAASRPPPPAPLPPRLASLRRTRIQPPSPRRALYPGIFPRGTRLRTIGRA